MATAAILESVGFSAETHLFPCAQPEDTCGHVVLTFLHATLVELGEHGFSKLNLSDAPGFSVHGAHELSKALMIGR